MRAPLHIGGAGLLGDWLLRLRTACSNKAAYRNGQATARSIYQWLPRIFLKEQASFNTLRRKALGIWPITNSNFDKLYLRNGRR